MTIQTHLNYINKNVIAKNLAMICDYVFFF